MWRHILNVGSVTNKEKIAIVITTLSYSDIFLHSAFICIFYSFNGTRMKKLEKYSKLVFTSQDVL